MSSLQKNLMKSKLPPMIPRPGKNHPGRQKDYSPSMWSNFFHDFIDVQTDGGKFRVYRSKPTESPDAPILVLLHGGGFSALSWAVFSTEITEIIHCRCLAIDFRGHGDTHTKDDDDLSAETLATDIGAVIEKIYENEQMPNVLILGHSMGGAIAVHVADMNLVPSLVGIIVIDVVEGTAMESLSAMQSFLRSRPKFFKSISNAIEWCVRSGQIRNIESAKVSMPGQIVNSETNMLATMELPLPNEDPTAAGMLNPMSIPEDETAEEQEEDDDGDEQDVQEKKNSAGTHDFSRPAAGPSPKKYTWRIDLSRTEKYWNGWFLNLSNKFLQIPIPKLLILAGIDNLDKTLQIGQMQGKFQLQVLARTGHAVHEDQPGQVAETLATYLVRNRFAESKSNFERVMPEC